MTRREHDSVTVAWVSARPSVGTHWATYLVKLSPEEIAGAQLASGLGGEL